MADDPIDAVKVAGQICIMTPEDAAPYIAAAAASPKRPAPAPVAPRPIGVWPYHRTELQPQLTRWPTP